MRRGVVALTLALYALAPTVTLGARSRFAIAHDSHGDLGTFTSVASPFTVALNNPAGDILFVGMLEYNAAGGPFFLGATYNGVAMTQVDHVTTDGGSGHLRLFMLVAPATGSHNFVADFGVGNTITAIVAEWSSYTGANSSGQPDAHTTNTASSATSITTNLTTSADNSWTVLISRNTVGTTSAGTGSTLRSLNGDGTVGIFDSGAAITPAGSTSMQVTRGTAANWGTAMASFAPTGGGGATSPLPSLVNGLRIGGGRLW